MCRRSTNHRVAWADPGRCGDGDLRSARRETSKRRIVRLTPLTLACTNGNAAVSSSGEAELTPTRIGRGETALMRQRALETRNVNTLISATQYRRQRKPKKARPLMWAPGRPRRVVEALIKAGADAMPV